MGNSSCPSCLDGVHGDCVLWGHPDRVVCDCPCEKRCAVRHPSRRLQHISCGLKLGHEGEHAGITPFTANPIRMQECLCGYMGSPGHRCSLTMASLHVTIEDAHGASVDFLTEPDREPIEVEWQIMTEVRKLKQAVSS